MIILCSIPVHDLVASEIRIQWNRQKQSSNFTGKPSKSWTTIECEMDHCAKDGGEDFLPRCTVLELRILNDPRSYRGIRVKNLMHLGKKFFGTIFSAIVCSRPSINSLPAFC